MSDMINDQVKEEVMDEILEIASKNDIFILASDLGEDNPSSAPYYSPFDLVRTGNGQDSFGILRTFYVAGYEQSYSLKHNFYGYNSTLEIPFRIWLVGFVWLGFVWLGYVCLSLICLFVFDCFAKLAVLGI